MVPNHVQQAYMSVELEYPQHLWNPQMDAGPCPPENVDNKRLFKVQDQGVPKQTAKNRVWKDLYFILIYVWYIL